VAWGVSLLPWNLTLQILLLPFYLWLLVGKVVPVSAATLFGSVGLYLVAPFALAYAVRVALGRVKGQAWVEGSYKNAIGEVKMWALAVLGVAAVAFAGHPLVLVAILVGPVVELPALLGISRLMVALRSRLARPGRVSPRPTARPVLSPTSRPPRARRGRTSDHTHDRADAEDRSGAAGRAACSPAQLEVGGGGSPTTARYGLSYAGRPAGGCRYGWLNPPRTGWPTSLRGRSTASGASARGTVATGKRAERTPRGGRVFPGRDQAVGARRQLGAHGMGHRRHRGELPSVA